MFATNYILEMVNCCSVETLGMVLIHIRKEMMKLLKRSCQSYCILILFSKSSCILQPYSSTENTVDKVDFEGNAVSTLNRSERL
jgi:hypothetical protein